MNKVLEFGFEASPEIVLMQAGWDGLKGDLLASLRYSLKGHLGAVEKIHDLAHEACGGTIDTRWWRI
jgi:acetoin utilization protein AcuC